MTISDAYILLVEDSEDDIFLTMRTLRKYRLVNEVVVARDGGEALEFLFGGGECQGRTSEILPQLVLLDINMPRVGGLEVLKRIRGDERTSVLPVVMFTSSKEDRDIIESYNNKANSYVRKPISSEDFAEAVEGLGTYWLLLNQAPVRPPGSAGG